MSEIRLQTVATGRDVNRFIKFAWKIYERFPHWVPPLLMDRRKLMDRKKNPFYKHADAEFFLAWRDGEIVGRIGAIINHHHIREHKERIGFFGFFECVDDQKVADKLFEAVRSWMKGRGVTALRGPANPSVNDEYGLLVEGFDLDPVVLMPYNPPYYAQLIERAGFNKIKDLYAYRLSEESVMSERLVGAVEKIRQREGLTFRPLDMKNFRQEVALIKDLYNRAWQYNWGAVPMTDEEFDAMAKDLKPVVIPELVIIAEYRNEPVGFALSLPDLNVALKHNRGGYLLPGLFHLTVRKKSIKRARIIVLGVIRERQKTGAAAVLFYETARRCIEHGYTEGEAGWVLEDNLMMNRSAELLNAERTKRYRLYQMSLEH